MYLSVGSTREIIGESRNSSKVLAQSISMDGLIRGNFDEVQSTFRPCSSLRLCCSNAHVCFRANEYAYLYCPPVFHAVTCSSDFKIQNSLLHVRKQPVDKN